MSYQADAFGPSWLNGGVKSPASEALVGQQLDANGALGHQNGAVLADVCGTSLFDPQRFEPIVEVPSRRCSLAEAEVNSVTLMVSRPDLEEDILNIETAYIDSARLIELGLYSPRLAAKQDAEQEFWPSFASFGKDLWCCAGSRVRRIRPPQEGDRIF